MKTCVINFGKNAWYPTGSARLVESLRTVGFTGDVHVFNDEAQIGAPTHQAAPYAFKPHALRWAVNQGYELVLWADSSCWAIKPIDVMFEHIAQRGHLFFYNCNTGNWSNDRSLEFFGVTREQAFSIPMLMGICMGWDMRTEKCQEFLRRWEAAIPTFPGSWTNSGQTESADPRVLGHRHDQTAASIIAWQLSLPLVIAHETCFQYYQNPQSTPFNGDLSLIHEPVVMVAQGM